jgi:hypothetical protein
MGFCLSVLFYLFSFFFSFSSFLCRGRDSGKRGLSRLYLDRVPPPLSLKMMKKCTRRSICQRRSCTRAEMGDEITTLPFYFSCFLSEAHKTHARELVDHRRLCTQPASALSTWLAYYHHRHHHHYYYYYYYYYHY